MIHLNKPIQSLSFLLILIGTNLFRSPWMIRGQSSGCPTPMPCTCNKNTKGLVISCEGVRLEILGKVFDNLQKTGQTLMYLTMKNNHMQTFPNSLLGDIDVRHLMAHQCSIVSVDRLAFSKLTDKIETIDFSQNKFVQVPSDALNGLKSLVSLNLNFNLIDTIHENAFDGLDSLLRLTLYGNKITHIHPNAFVGAGYNLTRIDLGGNRLTTIPAQSLRILKSVQLLLLHENGIQSLSSNDFLNWQSSDKLDMLNLAHNSISKLEKNLFVEWTTLNSLDFESNQISSIDSNTFYGIQDTLEWLKLGENQLNEIPYEALKNLTKLRELDLRGNHIQIVHSSSFDDFGQNIKFLNLQRNKISKIETGAFDNLESLQQLNLKANRLKHIPMKLYEPLVNRKTHMSFHDNPLICTCEMKWYQRWLTEQSPNDPTQPSNQRELRCELFINHTTEVLSTINNIPSHISVETMFEQLRCSTDRILPIFLVMNVLFLVALVFAVDVPPF